MPSNIKSNLNINEKRLVDLCYRGVDFGRDWYARANKQLQTIADEFNTSIDTVAMLASGYSVRTSVLRSIKFTIWHLRHGTRPPGSMAMVYDLSIAGLNRGYHNGPKIEAFRRCLLGCSDSLVLDTWIAKAINVPQSKLYQKSVYPTILGAFQSVSDNAGLSIAECQACIWVGIMRENNRTDLDLVPRGRFDECMSFGEGV